MELVGFTTTDKKKKENVKVSHCVLITAVRKIKNAGRDEFSFQRDPD